MKIKALDMNINEYVEVTVIDLHMNKKLEISHIEMVRPSGELIYLKRHGKSVYRNNGYEYLINESDLKGVKEYVES